MELVVDLRTLRSLARPDARAATGLAHRYDIHGIVTVGSTVLLKELEPFRSDELEGPFDIEVRPGTVLKVPGAAGETPVAAAPVSAPASTVPRVAPAASGMVQTHRRHCPWKHTRAPRSPGTHSHP